MKDVACMSLSSFLFFKKWRSCSRSW